jgi:methionyl-tRNA formyltransferase
VAEAAGVEVLTPVGLRDPELLGKLRALDPDCCPVIAYGVLVPPAALEIPRHGWVNLHFSVLPAWRGAAPVHCAIAAGDGETGVTVFRLDEGLDTGPVFATMVEPLRPDDTSGSVLARLAAAGAELLVRVLDGIEAGELEPRPQPEAGVSLAPKVAAADARLAFDVPAPVVERRIRAFTPEPGAWTVLRGDRIRVFPVSVVPGEPPTPPGVVRVTRRHVLVGTATDPLALGLVQPPGKRPMPAVDWARGVRDLDGSVLAAAPGRR